jgi:hypothetical protein
MVWCDPLAKWYGFTRLRYQSLIRNALHLQGL